MALVLKPPSLGDLMVFEDFPTQHQTKPIAEKKHDWPSRTEKRFKCVYEGCDRAYTKPSRLAEHEMTHRNERPFACSQCPRTYFREDHLKAHARTHSNVKIKPFQCTREGCKRSFWTASKLRRHEEVHDKDGAYPCDKCDAAFNKHHLLREHVALAHMPPGTKPFICTHEGCSASFATKTHLKNHEKTHDERRYICSHHDHGEDFPAFSKWTELQKHISTEHAPTCPHPECNGRIFKNNQRLRDHLRVHADQQADKAALADRHEEEVPQLLLEGLGKSRKKRKSFAQREAEDNGPRKLRKILDGDAGKDWACEHESCDKKFKSRYALETHVKVVHQNIREHVCPREGCGKAYAYKANLNQHLAKHNLYAGPSKSASTSESGMLTGMVKEMRRFICPAWALGVFPENGDMIVAPRRPELLTEDGNGNEQLQSIVRCRAPASESTTIANTSAILRGSKSEDLAGKRCILRFWRVYDVRRHLKSEHHVELDDMQVRRLLLSTGQTGE
ncbi:transcription factor iiia [Cryptococcus neoformans 125.91]|nr:transcription factor iiia [Cryptococcus neoformans var. grubii 125.91]OXG77555.1 transcription factor iiia [Cryptococcus neoformans var. grubii MW-RSA36]OXL07221.1 transcription factor iiia [Cryptococcus neoformans var. grubii Gb118]